MSSQVMADNLEACLDASGKLLSVGTQIKDLKSLDTTWMQTTDFLAAIFTTLFIYSQRQSQMSSTDLQQLRQDMNAWLDVMRDAGHLLGAGYKVRDAVKGIIDYLLGNIGRHIATKTASAATGLTASIGDVDSADSSNNQSEEPPNDELHTANKHFTGQYLNGQPNGAVQDERQDSISTGQQKGEHQLSYDSQTQVYGDSADQTMPHYASDGLQMFQNADYSEVDVKPAVHGQPNGATPPIGPATAHQHFHASQMQQHQVPGAFQMFAPPQPNGYPFATPHMGLPNSGGPAAWRNFTDSMLTNMGGHDFMHSASALMALGNNSNQDLSIPGGAVGTMGTLQLPHDAHQNWPLVHYNSHPPNGQQ